MQRALDIDADPLSRDESVSIGRLGNPATSFVDARIALVVDAIRTDPAGQASTADLAARVNLGVSRLRHLFRATVGISLDRFRKDRRLEVAAHRLLMSHDRVSEIAYSLGFRQTSEFDRAFRHRFGQAPRNYRAGRGGSSITTCAVSRGDRSS